MIWAEQIDNRKLMIFFNVLQTKTSSSTNRTILVIIIIVLVSILNSSDYGLYFFLKKYKSRSNCKKIDFKYNSLDDVVSPE